MRLDSGDAAARVAYYTAWAFEGTCLCPSDPSRPMLHAFACPARLYTLFSRIFPDGDAFDVFDIEWPRTASRLRAAFDAACTANPRGFLERVSAGLAGGDQRPRLREQLVAQMRQACLDLWRTSGQLAKREDATFWNIETAILAIAEQSMRGPLLSDVDLVRRSRATFVTRTAQTTPLRREDVEAYVSAYITIDRVAEGRRRSRENAAGKVLAATEAQLRSEGMTEQELAAGRDMLVDLALGFRK